MAYQRMQPILPSELAYPARPDAKFYLHEFVQPLSLPIYEIARKVMDLPDDEAMERAFMLAIAPIDYVLDSEQFNVPDYFQFPYETLMAQKGDCEDTANLLTSILRAAGIQSALTAYGTLTIEDVTYRHAWTEANYIVIETTIDEFIPVTRPPEYYAEVLVNDAVSYTMLLPKPVSWEAQSDPLPKLPKELLPRLKELLKQWQRQYPRTSR